MGTGPLQCLVSSGGWPRGCVLASHSPPMVPQSLARESQHACLFFHPTLCNTETVSQHSHSGINKTSRWHESVPEGITRLVSSFTSPPCRITQKCTQRLGLLWCCVCLSNYYCRYCLYCAFSYLFIFIFFISTLSPVLTPHGSFNSTITQHSTISARASAGWIRVTWTAPDCNQSENNECRTKSGTITAAGLTFLSLSVFSSFHFFFSYSLRVYGSTNKQQNRGGKLSSRQSW